MLLLRELTNDKEQMPQQHLVLDLQVIERWNLLFGNQQHVRRRLRIDVAKRQALVVLIDDLGRDFLVDDPFENGLFTHERSPSIASDASDPPCYKQTAVQDRSGCACGPDVLST